MLSYKDRKPVQPSYDYYLETDLDSVDDQPVDYSKRYADQDADEECGSTSAKKRHLSTPSVNSYPNKQPDDELRVYCLEGTPLMISSASSLCDLRDTGGMGQVPESLTVKEQAGKRQCFSQSPGFANSGPEECEKKCIDNEVLLSNHSEKEEEANKEGKSIILENEATFTKTSSPLMFSRSSSVGSLNSFEQQSIVDDRSLGSVFSTLTSGIISPSEIPDSPGEAMSPFIQKNKQNEFLFPTTEKSLDPLLVQLKTNPSEQFTDEAFVDLPEDDIKVYNDEGDCSSVSNLSALSIQANSTRVSISVIQHKKAFIGVTHKSSVKVSCSITAPDSADFMEKSDDLNVSEEIYKPEPDCSGNFSGFINLMPASMKAVQDEETKSSVCPSLIAIETTCVDKGTSTSDDFGFGNLDHAGYKSDSSPFKENSSQMPYLQENESADYSKDNSDDESDALLEECILSGKPSVINSNHESVQSYQSDIVSTSKFTKDAVALNSSNLSETDMLLDQCEELGKPDSVYEQESSGKSHKSSSFNAISKSKDQDTNKELNGSDEDSDVDENDFLVQECIQLGMPETELKVSNDGKAAKNPIPFPPSKDLGYRDNCPDGISDADEDDDDMVSECIRAGMPDEKPIPSGSQFTESTKSSPSQNLRKPTAAEDRAMFLKKNCYSNLMQSEILRNACASPAAVIGVDDSTCVYRTEDTPILSPTASLSDLSTLSFADDKVYQESFLNNSRNSDCSSESEDDELLIQCIRSGMPLEKRAFA